MQLNFDSCKRPRNLPLGHKIFDVATENLQILGREQQMSVCHRQKLDFQRDFRSRLQRFNSKCTDRLHLKRRIGVLAIRKLELQQFRRSFRRLVGFRSRNVARFHDLQNGQIVIDALELPLAQVTDAGSDVSQVELKADLR